MKKFFVKSGYDFLMIFVLKTRILRGESIRFISNFLLFLKKGQFSSPRIRCKKRHPADKKRVILFGDHPYSKEESFFLICAFPLWAYLHPDWKKGS